MSEVKHTPGPWIWGPRYDGLYGAGPNNEVLAYAAYEGMWLSSNNQKANASLIAAAPDLLEALQYAHDYLAGNGWEGDPRMDRIIAAIAKAEGRS